MMAQTTQLAGDRYIGQKIGNFVLERPIVSSDERNRLVLDMGRKCSVYLAYRDGAPQIKKAVKIYIPEISRNSTFSEELAEFRIWHLMETQNVDKTHIVDITDGGFIDGLDERLNLNDSAYLVMEYMNDGTLWDYSSSMNLEQKVMVFLDIAQGIKATHSTQPPIAHGDIHPGQMLHDRGKGWKLSDFGVSAIIERAHGYTTRSSRRGAVRYRDPVMEKEKAITLPNDIYQLGMSMFEILAGISIVDIDTKESFTRGYQEIPPNLKALMISCIRGDAAKRPDIKGVIGTLQEVVIPTMSPQYNLAVSDTIKRLREKSGKYKASRFGVLSSPEIDEFFSTLRTSYNLMHTRGFKTPVPEIELIVGDTMERDLQHMTEFIVKHHKNGRNLRIPEEMSKAPKSYRDSIDRWEQNRQVDIDFENWNYLIVPKNPRPRGS
jgi:serine/threonine protein kinase